MYERSPHRAAFVAGDLLRPLSPAESAAVDNALDTSGDMQEVFCRTSRGVITRQHATQLGPGLALSDVIVDV